MMRSADAQCGCAVRMRSADAQCERLADAFAVELLTGDPEMRYVSDLWLSSDQLAEAAQNMSQEARVDPGVVALNYAWGKEFPQVGVGALKIIEPMPTPCKPCARDARRGCAGTR